MLENLIKRLLSQTDIHKKGDSRFGKSCVVMIFWAILSKSYSYSHSVDYSFGFGHESDPSIWINFYSFIMVKNKNFCTVYVPSVLDI